MPITPFLNGQKFDAETRRVLGVAFELVCVALRIGDCDDDVKQCIASQIIELASDGERNPDVLCERALKLIRAGRQLKDRRSFNRRRNSGPCIPAKRAPQKRIAAEGGQPP